MKLESLHRCVAEAPASKVSPRNSAPLWLGKDGGVEPGPQKRAQVPLRPPAAVPSQTVQAPQSRHRSAPPEHAAHRQERPEEDRPAQAQAGDRGDGDAGEERTEAAGDGAGGPGAPLRPAAALAGGHLAGTRLIRSPLADHTGAGPQAPSEASPARRRTRLPCAPGRPALAGPSVTDGRL